MAADGIHAPGAAFLAALSRELREPVRLMTRWVSLLAAASDDPAIVARAVRGLEHSLRQQGELADDLLEVAHLAAGRLPMTWTTFDVVDALRASVDHHRQLGLQHRVELSVEAPADPVMVAGDEGRVRQVVDTLLDHALAGAVAGQSVHTSVRAVDGRCEIEISDGGHAAAAKTPPDRAVPGDGGALPDLRRDALALVLARHLIEAHGGVMDVAGERGTAFHVQLPRVPDVPRGAPARLRGERILEGLHILVVDDDQTTREALGEALTQMGGRLTIAPSVATALERLRGAHFDAVCSDIEMPIDSGVVLARTVRAAESGGRRQPLIAVSGLVGEDHEAAARQAGFDAFLAKPVDVERLARRLRALVDAARADQLERNSPNVANDGT
ncbi:MAG TPA: hybrid sensor histidine kinase/response regulator [Candidatus Dormibacteraeota bacterium]|nr:hybrid sensor histidine kinase/response regulator [Candidatus Dormibacteraeota bacterium]